MNARTQTQRETLFNLKPIEGDVKKALYNAFLSNCGQAKIQALEEAANKVRAAKQAMNEAQNETNYVIDELITRPANTVAR